MASLTVRRLRSRYHLDPRDTGTRRRLDAVLDRIVDTSLDRAVDAAGMPDTELVCVRRLRAVLRPDLSHSDAALAADWAALLAQTLRDTLERGDGHVVRYRSPAHALASLVTDVAGGELDRSWAWTALGLWSRNHRPDGVHARAAAVRDALCSRPSLAAAVLSDVARRVSVRRFLTTAFGEADWAAVAEAALEAADLRVPDDARTGDAEPALPRPVLEDPLLDLARSPGLPAGSARHLAVLILLRGAPGNLRRSDAPARVAAVTRLLTAGADTTDPERAETEDGTRAEAPGDDEARRAPDSRGSRPPSRAGRRDARPASERAARPGSSPHSPPHSTELSPGTPGSPSSDVRPPGRGVRTHPEASAPSRAGTAPEVPSAEARVAATTRLAGLAFLLRTLDELEVPDRILAGPALSARPLRWSLHALARTLAPADPGDAAALLFCGLAPDAEPPSAGEESPTRPEREELEEVARDVRRHVRERMGDDRPPDEVMAEVTERQGAVTADPGWIEVRLPLDEVSVRVRRAGLDLDPGWLPWLGVVVRIVYA